MAGPSWNAHLAAAVAETRSSRVIVDHYLAFFFEYLRVEQWTLRCLVYPSACCTVYPSACCAVYPSARSAVYPLC